MPQVKESLLDHNVELESRMHRMWEDEAIDIKMRDLRISECGVITQLKAQ